MGCGRRMRCVRCMCCMRCKVCMGYKHCIRCSRGRPCIPGVEFSMQALVMVMPQPRFLLSERSDHLERHPVCQVVAQPPFVFIAALYVAVYSWRYNRPGCCFNQSEPSPPLLPPLPSSPSPLPPPSPSLSLASPLSFPLSSVLCDRIPCPPSLGFNGVTCGAGFVGRTGRKRG